MDHTPDDKRGDGEDQPGQVIEVDGALVADRVAELEGLDRDQAVSTTADEAGPGHGENARQLMERQGQEHDIDAAQPQSGQADAQRGDHCNQRRDEDGEEWIPAEAVNEHSRGPAANGEERHLGEGVDAAVTHDQVPRLRYHRLNEEQDQERDQVGADVDADEQERQHDACGKSAAYRPYGRAAPRRGSRVELWTRDTHGPGGLRAHSRLTSPIPNRPFGRTISIRMIRRKTPG